MNISCPIKNAFQINRALFFSGSHLIYRLSYHHVSFFNLMFARWFRMRTHTTNYTCIASVSFSYTYRICYDARIQFCHLSWNNHEFRARKHFTRLKYHFNVTIFDMFQVIINVIWMIISPARAMHHYPTREDNLLVCDSYVDASYMIAFSYPIFLIVICTVYAVLTRKIPEAFNESKHIGE